MQGRRKQAGLTQRQLSIELDVTETTIQNWERGKVAPHLPPDKMQKLCELLKVDLQELAKEFSQN